MNLNIWRVAPPPRATFLSHTSELGVRLPAVNLPQSRLLLKSKHELSGTEAHSFQGDAVS